MKRILFLVVLSFILFLNSNVYAACGTDDINRLKELAKNVEVSYEHNVYGNRDEDDGEMMSVYTMDVIGVTDELYIVDDNGNAFYSFSAVDGVINFITSSGKRKVYVFSKNCVNKLLRTITVDLPTFNFNSLNDECQKEEFKDLDICSEFIKDDKEVISGEEFDETVQKIEDEQKNIFDKIIDFVINNLIVVIIGIVIIISLIVFLFLRHRKRSVLE